MISTNFDSKSSSSKLTNLIKIAVNKKGIQTEFLKVKVMVRFIIQPQLENLPSVI